MFSDILAKSQKYIIDNSPTILTALGVVGSVGTAVLAGQASIKAVDVLRAAERDAEIMDEPPLSNKEKFILTWQLFIPTAVSGSFTIAAIVGSNAISNRRAAALAAAYSLAEKAIAEYKEKVIEKVGPNKERAIRDEIAQDRVDRNPPSQLEIHPNGRPGDVLCYDTYSGRYFYSTMEDIRRAENAVNKTIVNGYYAALTDLYDQLGLDRTKFSDEIGWNTNRLLEIRFSTTMSDDQRPCMVIDFDTEPIRMYSRLQ